MGNNDIARAVREQTIQYCCTSAVLACNKEECIYNAKRKDDTICGNCGCATKWFMSDYAYRQQQGKKCEYMVTEI